MKLVLQDQRIFQKKIKGKKSGKKNSSTAAQQIKLQGRGVSASIGGPLWSEWRRGEGRLVRGSAFMPNSEHWLPGEFSQALHAKPCTSASTVLQFFSFVFVSCICGFAYMCVCAPHNCNAHSGQKRVSDPLAPKLELLVSNMRVQGIKSASSGRATGAKPCSTRTRMNSLICGKSGKPFGWTKQSP